MLATAQYEFQALSTRSGFNRSLRHFTSVGEIVEEFEGYRNLADILNEMLEEKELELPQLSPIVHALLVGHPKYNYCCSSYTLKVSFEEFAPICAEVKKWNSVDLLLAYFHPDIGLTLINPKNQVHWDLAQGLKKNELITVYCGTFTDKGDDKLMLEAINKIIQLHDGKKISIPAAFTKGKFKAPRPLKVKKETLPKVKRKKTTAKKKAVKEFKKPDVVQQAPAVAAPAAAAPPTGAAVRMTPKYSIPVTNELFHNGNVEAWKKIIQSYNAKYPKLEVFIFYDGERILDINTLFKWGKVKHGSAILVAVAGEDITDVAKLQRYLRQGASHLFEAFLKFPVNTVLNLF